MKTVGTWKGAGLVAAAVMTLTAGGATAQEVTLRLHQFLPAQAPVPAQVLEPWMQRIEEQSEGRIAFDHYPAMQLGGSPASLVDQVRDGVADVVWTLPGYTPGRFPRTEVFELPFMSTDAEATSRALWQLAEEEMLDTEFSDVKVLGLWVHGPGVIHSEEPIAAPEDMAGVNLRTPTRVMGELITATGGNPIGMPVPQVPEALSRGVIDGAVVPWEVTGAIRASELVENHTEFPGAAPYTATFVLAMNRGVYDALPEDLKAVIDANSGLEFSAEAGRITAEADAGPRQVAVDRGNNIIELTEEQAQAWHDAAEPVTAAWIESASGAGLDGQALFDRARELIEQNSGE